MFAGETYQAGIGQGYDVVTPIQLINAYAALANGGKLYQPQVVREVIGPDGTVVRPFKPKLIHKLDVPPSVLKTMRLAARNVVRSATPTTSSTCRSRSPASPARPSSGPATARAACRSTRGSSASRRRTRTTAPSTRRDSKLVVLAFAYDSRTKGNAATEIVKYFFQLHYGIKKDYRNLDLLKRGNFYQSN